MSVAALFDGVATTIFDGVPAFASGALQGRPGREVSRAPRLASHSKRRGEEEATGALQIAGA
jgi:hypothetical protein